MKKVSIDEMQHQADLANITDKNFIDNCNFLIKNPKKDNIYSEELTETLKYFSNFYKLGNNYSYQCYGAGHYLPWHTDTYLNEIGCIIIPLNKDGKGIIETVYESETFTRSYTETVCLNTTHLHKINPVLTDYVYLRIPIIP